MPKDEPTWKLVYEAAKKLDAEFTPIEIIREINRTHPDAKANTIRCHVFGMSENHPSSVYYAYLREKHPYLWYLGSGKYRLRRPSDKVEDVPTPTPVAEPHISVKEWPYPSTRNLETVNRMRKRVEELNSNFRHYLDVFSRENHFSGPSTYFHYKTLRIRESIGNTSRLLLDENFIDSLYATLASWGLHRMGTKGARLVDHEVFRNSLGACASLVTGLAGKSLLEMDRVEAQETGAGLAKILTGLQVSQSGTQLVAGAKALHHILPGLVPPIDRNYTIRFFYNDMRSKVIPIPYGDDGRVFTDLYPIFHFIGERNRDAIREAVGGAFCTSETKAIDNAIMGYVIEKMGEEAAFE